MTTYYVRADGTAASKATATSAASAATAMSMATHNSQTFSAGDVVVISAAGGVYGTGLTIVSSGAAGNPITYTNAPGENPVIQVASGNALTLSNKNYTETSNILFIGRPVSYSAGTGNKISYCIVKSSGAEGIIAANVGLAINNCLVIGCFSYGVKGSSNCVVVLRNSIIIGNGVSFGYGTYNTGAGLFDQDYNIIIGNNRSPANNYLATGITDGGHNIYNYHPKLKSYIVNKAYFVYTVDDDIVSYWTSLINVMNQYGHKLTMFAIGSSMNGYQTTLQGFQNQGHEIGSHSWSHTNLTAASLFSITTTNANPTINIDNAAKTVTLSTTTGGNSVTVSWSAGNKTLGDLQAAVAGKGWTITLGTSVSTLSWLDGLADTGGAVAVPYTALPDLAPTYRYWKNEVQYNETYLRNTIGISADTGSYPYSFTNVALQNWIRDNTTHKAWRSNNLPIQLASFNVWDAGETDIDFTGGANPFGGTSSEADLRRSAQHLYVYCMVNGFVFLGMSHNATEFPVDKFTWFMDEFSKLGVKMQTFKSVIAELTANHTTSDNATYTATYPDVLDARLVSGSPAIAAGTAVGIATDYAGKPVKSTPSMGVYEYTATPKPSGFRFARLPSGRW